MHRPCFLVIDPEHAGSISTRKLVIETAKLNVITAYSGEEALGALQRFPAVDAVILDATMPDMPCGELVAALRKLQPGTPIIAIGATAEYRCQGADYKLASFEPPRLLDFLRSLVPDAARLMQTEEETREEVE